MGSTDLGVVILESMGVSTDGVTRVDVICKAHQPEEIIVHRVVIGEADELMKNVQEFYRREKDKFEPTPDHWESWPVTV